MQAIYCFCTWQWSPQLLRGSSNGRQSHRFQLSPFSEEPGEWQKKLQNEDPSILNVRKVCTVVQIPGQVPAPLCPVAPDGCHPSCRGWRSSCPDNLFWCYFVSHVNFSPETVLLTCGAMSRFTEWVSALLMLDVPNNPQWAPSCRGQFNLEKLAMSSHRSHCGSRPAPTGFYSNLEKPQSMGVHCQKKVKCNTITAI